MPEVLLSARRVARRFGRRVVLEPIDLDLAGGEVVALGGPNGAGKSTLLAILAGALAPTGGEVATAEPARVGWMPQQPALYRRLTPRENLELFARLAGLDEPGRSRGHERSRRWASRPRSGGRPSSPSATCSA